MKFINRLNDIKFNNKLVNNLAKEFNVSNEVIKILFSRGITNKTDIDQFLNSSINQFYNPFQLSGMASAVSAIQQAVKDNKKILIVGDYDTDGICSTAILYKYFESIGKKVDYFLPNRFADGYGLTIDTVNKIVEKFAPQFIITVDCGISCYKEVDYIKSLGIDIVVTDHHEIPEIIPDCICVDPKLQSDYPFKELCGAGVALKVIQALSGLNEALKYTCIAALATVADIVPLKSENRAIVKHGLAHANSLPVGVLQLIENLKIKELSSSDIAFKIAPKLNTAGRMGDATVAFKLFIEKNPTEILEILTLLEQQNNQRIEAGNSIYEDCINQLKNQCISDMRAIVLYSQSWHAGVLGIICAKLTEKFNRPVCLLTKVDNVYKGSIRSLPGIDIFKELTKCSDILVKFGGHSGAGGLTIEESNLELFKQRLNDNIKNTYDDSYFEPVKYYDFNLNKEDVTIDYVKSLQVLEPFGFGNEKPVFMYTFNNIKPERLKNYPNYIKIRTDKLEIMTFNLSEYYDSLLTNCNKNVILDINIETYNNRERLKGIIKNLMFEKLSTSVRKDVVLGYYAKQLISPSYREYNNIVNINVNDIESIMHSNFGTLIVTNSFESYKFAIEHFSSHIINYESYSVKDYTGSNTLLFMAKSTLNFSNFNNVIFLDDIINKDYLLGFKSNIYLCSINHDDNMLTTLDCSRKEFGYYHSAIKITNAKEQHSYSEQEYFNLIKFNSGYKNLKFNQFIFVTQVLSQLNIIDIDSQLDYYNISINNKVTSQLNNSSIYNFVKLYKDTH